MRTIRLTLRLLVLGLTTLVLWCVLMVGWPLAALRRRGPAWCGTMTSVWAVCLVRIFGIRIDVEGDAPPAGVLLVSNHLSYMDIVLLASRVRCSFVSKSEIASWPLVGYLARLVGTLFIDRARRRDVKRVGNEVRALLDVGRTVVVFPEGTSTSGADVAPFRASLLEPAVSTGRPVYCVTLRYTERPGETAASESVAWWGDMDFLPHFANLLRMSGFSARIVFGNEAILETDRKTLARRLHSAVASRFIPMHPAEGACLTPRTSPANS